MNKKTALDLIAWGYGWEDWDALMTTYWRYGKEKLLDKYELLAQKLINDYQVYDSAKK